MGFNVILFLIPEHLGIFKLEGARMGWKDSMFFLLSSSEIIFLATEKWCILSCFLAVESKQSAIFCDVLSLFVFSQPTIYCLESSKCLS